MTIEELKNKGYIIFEGITGSKAYGLDTENSDTDIRGVFILPTDDFIKSNGNKNGTHKYIDMVSDKKNDTVYYEIGKFIELLEKGNPNILELLNLPKDKTLYKDLRWDKYFPKKQNSLYLTKQLKNTFVGYAKTQIKKAQGLNKKVFNPIDKEKKSILDFTYIIRNGKATKFKKFFGVENKTENEILEMTKNWSVSKANVGYQLYHVYLTYNGKGLIKDFNSTQFKLTSIPKTIYESENPYTLYFNQNGFQKYSKDYKEYWEWVKKRNKQRYLDNTKNKNINYDVKNMMHTIRLLEMALDIVNKNKIIVKRPNREELLEIRKGNIPFDKIIKKAETYIKELDNLFDKLNLKENVDTKFTRNLLLKIRLENLKNPFRKCKKYRIVETISNNEIKYKIQKKHWLFKIIWNDYCISENDYVNCKNDFETKEQAENYIMNNLCN